MNRARPRTLGSRHLAPLVMTMLSLMAPSSASSIDVSATIDSIISGSRTVLLLAPLPTRVLVIVSSPASKVLDTGAIVFDEPPNHLTNRSMLLSSPALFTHKWPELPSTADSLGVLHDNVNDQHSYYLVISSPLKLYFLNLATNQLDTKDLSLYKFKPDGFTFDLFFGKGHLLLFSPVTRQVYSLFPVEDTQQKIAQGVFTGDQSLPNTDKIQYAVGEAVCISDDDTQVKFANVESDSCTPSQASNNWQTSAGYMTDSSIFFFDSSHQSVYIFSKSEALASSWTRFTSVFFSDYWIKSAGPSLPHQHGKKGQHTTTGFLSLTSIIIISVAVFSIILITVISLVAFCLCRASTPENPEMAATGKPEGDNRLAAQSKVALRNASKGNFKRKGSKGIASKVAAPALAEDDLQAVRESTMMVYAVDGMEAKNRKAASKLCAGGKRRTSKGGSPSKRRVTSSRLVASPRRSSALKAQSNAGGRRASSGKLPTSRRPSKAQSQASWSQEGN